jgi:hypothetical protein
VFNFFEGKTENQKRPSRIELRDYVTPTESRGELTLTLPCKLKRKEGRKQGRKQERKGKKELASKKKEESLL